MLTVHDRCKKNPTAIGADQGTHGIAPQEFEVSMLTHGLQRLVVAVQIPPPWFWCGAQGLWRRPSPTSRARLPLELAQQLHWWWIRPWRQPWRRPPGLPAIPWQMRLRACWLNSYRPRELAWWWALGETSWQRLARHTPESLSAAVHATRRNHWPDRCRPALEVLADKGALLGCAPQAWRAPFLVLHAEPSAVEPQREGAGDPGIPTWWWHALSTEGVVLKPLRGHAGRSVIRFRWTGSALTQTALFRRLPADAPLLEASAAPEPARLLAHWHRLCRSQEPVLAAPYLCHSTELLATDPAVVVRVITARPSPEAPVAVREAWLEVPLAPGCVAFLSPEGRSLPNPGAPLSAEEQSGLDAWAHQLRQGVPPCVKACLNAAVHMHGRLTPIDQVAWDWIPSSPEPLLLEGNGGFGLLMPQLWAEHRAATDRPGARTLFLK